MKILRRTVLSICAVVAIVLLAVTAVVLLSVRRDSAAQETLGRLAPKIDTDGRRVRDLNKNGSVDPYEDPRVATDQRVEDLVGQMTVAEKVGLMLQPPIFMEPDGSLKDGWGGAFMQGFGTAEAIAGRQIRHFNLRNSSDCEAMAEWNNRLQEMAERTRLGIPVTISTDPRHGVRDAGAVTSVGTKGFSLWPEPLGLAATRDRALVKRFGEIANQEYRAVGIRTALHPMADLATEPRWGRAIGTFGEDVGLVSEMVVAYIDGFQGPEIGNESVLCMTKHFPGGGPQKDGLDAHFSYGGDQAYPGDAFETHLIPFEAAIAAGTAQMMPYYGVPVGQTSEDVAMGFNRDVITGLLRDRFGFDGVVCTDWQIVAPKGAGPIEVIHARSFGVDDLSIPQRYRKALDAGVDQFGGEEDPAPLIGLVESGALPEERLDTSVRRILRDQFRLGLFDDPYVDASAAVEICDQPEFHAAGAEAQRRSIVLLQNDEDLQGDPRLPLAPETRLYIENIDPSVAAHYGTVVPTLDEADVALIRMQTPWVEHPPETIGDRIFNTLFHQGDLDFKGETLEHLQTVARTKPTILAIYLDRPAVLAGVAEYTAGILGHFGATDEALLDIAFGRSTPRGKLPIELPSSMEAVRGQKEDLPHDSTSPLFPFGFGLTYD
ncbi:MAG: glycoside hydrolase family 3 N-terminal domain-containing protein [Candidatus Binatia bacterium]|nr:glycoside hydrolase family 3 N-terminal domain-containing protein [Candidatus Binatia bacterium]